MGLSEECDQLQSFLIKTLNILAEVKTRTNYLLECDHYELDCQISYILDICHDELNNLKISLDLIELIQGMIGTQGFSAATTVRDFSASDFGKMSLVDQSLNSTQSQVTLGSSSNFPTGSFFNQLPGDLDRELREADDMGIIPLKVGDAGFDEVIERGRIKWAVTTDRELFVIPQSVDGQEIYHTVLSRGQPVLAAGVTDIVSSSGQYIMTYISNYSGHFEPTPDSLEIGKAAFKQQGIDPLTADEDIIE